MKKYLLLMIILFNYNFQAVAATANKQAFSWQKIPPEAVAMDAQLFSQLENALDLPESGNKHSFLVIKGHKIIFESYRSDKQALIGYEQYKYIDYQKSTPHLLFSSTKSVIATLAGVALQQGIIGSLDERIIDYYPELKGHLDKSKHDITIRHALDMAIGLDFNEWDTSISRMDPDHIWTRFGQVSDQQRLTFTFNQPIIKPPGTLFQYSGGAVDMVAKVIARASGLSIEQYAQQALFGPLGIDNVSWLQHAGGGTATDWGLSLTPRDFAKIGLLYINNGMWQGQRLLSQAWIDDCYMPAFTEVAFGTGYSNFWYSPKFYQRSNSFWQNAYRNGDKLKVITSWGYGGQHLFIFPDLELIVVTTAGNWMFAPDLTLQYDIKKELSPFNLIADYVLPAVNNKQATFKAY